MVNRPLNIGALISSTITAVSNRTIAGQTINRQTNTGEQAIADRVRPLMITNSIIIGAIGVARCNSIVGPLITQQVIAGSMTTQSDARKRGRPQIILKSTVIGAIAELISEGTDSIESQMEEFAGDLMTRKMRRRR